ncbi:choice-of-anchor Q domain-containing protein [soil metagenome]
MHRIGTVRWLVLFVLAAACGDDMVAGSVDGSIDVAPGDGRADADASTDASTPTCGAAPSESFDPLALYVAPKVTPTTIVTSTNDDGAGSLRAAVAAGGVIGFAPALAGKTITLASAIEIGGSLRVDGSDAAGITIDAAGKGSAFHFNGDAPTKLSFFLLRIVNGKTNGSGGAISVNGKAIDLEIGGVRFESNAAGEGGALRVGYAGGSTFHVHHSSFLSNDGTLTKSGFSGGAISSIGGVLTIDHCRFEKNVGVATGAVYTIHANPDVSDSVFVENRSAGASGSGGFFADGAGPGDYNSPKPTPPGTMALRRTLFVRNRGAGDDSGAAELYAYPADTVIVEGSVFLANTSNPGRAGALFIHADKNVEIRRTAFLDNEASGGPGGAIWADGDGVYTFENDLFDGNRTDADYGGALRLNVSDKSKLRISYSIFSDNVAANGNGAIWMGGKRDATSTSSIYVGNTGSAGAQQVNFPIADDESDIEWPKTGAATKSLASARGVDPMLGPRVADSGTFIRAPKPGSPALETGALPAPATDQRGAVRGAKLDVGSVEVGAGCP